MRHTLAFSSCLVSLISVTAFGQSRPIWAGYGNDAQHTGISSIRSKPLTRIVWSTPLDAQPQYYGTSLLTHYGSPAMTSTGAVLLSLKTGASDGWEFQARRNSDGSLIWKYSSDYTLPGHGWTPPVSGVLFGNNTYAMPGVGGSIIFRTFADTTVGVMRRVRFYGEGLSAEEQAQADASIKVCTPLTADVAGNIYFGFRVQGTNPLGFGSGYARVDSKGRAKFVEASAMVPGDAAADRPALSAAPAITTNGQVAYVVPQRGSGLGYLVAIDTRTFATKYTAELLDPSTGGAAIVSDSSSASPTIGPDGTVFFGVLANPVSSNHYRGWMLQFNARLGLISRPGAFGWDDSASIVPRSMVPSYNGRSKYLLLTKYNNYAIAGDGRNRVAVVDPGASDLDPISGLQTMKVVLSLLGPTPDSEYPNLPGAVREWCINSAAIDVQGKCAIVNCEDGVLYKWDLVRNVFSESIRLTDGVGEAYTPTMIGKDGTVFAINNAILFAVRN